MHGERAPMMYRNGDGEGGFTQDDEACGCPVCECGHPACFHVEARGRYLYCAEAGCPCSRYDESDGGEDGDDGND